MTIVIASIEHLNPGQVPGLAADQTHLALVKEIQWALPSIHVDQVQRIAYRDVCVEGTFYDRK